MSIKFTKMHGAGNDFIILDESFRNIAKDKTLIGKLCDRKRGIGADGLIIISRLSGKSDFRMNYFNSDGSSAEMCGNGLRCSALYAFNHLGSDKKTRFKTGSGILKTEITGATSAKIAIPVTQNFKRIKLHGKTMFFGATGVPHTVVPLKNILETDVFTQGRKIRQDNFFAPAGTNVDFVSLPEKGSEYCRIRTYERGVENETSACGTGISASALCLHNFFGLKSPLKFLTLYNDVLNVEITKLDNIVGKMEQVMLEGPAVEVFYGEL